MIPPVKKCRAIQRADPDAHRDVGKQVPLGPGDQAHHAVPTPKRGFAGGSLRHGAETTIPVQGFFPTRR